MEENIFKNLKHLIEKWYETGVTEIIPTVKVCAAKYDFSGEFINPTTGEKNYIPFACGQDIKIGDILHNVESFQLKSGITGDIIWRLRVKDKQYDCAD